MARGRPGRRSQIRPAQKCSGVGIIDASPVSRARLLRQDLAMRLLPRSDAKLARSLTDFSPEETRKVRGVGEAKPKGNLLH